MFPGASRENTNPVSPLTPSPGSREALMSDEAVAFGLLAERCDEPQVVERRWSEAINQAPHVHHGILRLLRQAREQHLGVHWLAPDQLAGSFELQGKARECWPQAIMEV